MKTPKLGDLRHRITLRKHSNTPEIGGSLNPAYSDEFECWAQVQPVGTALYQQGLQLDDVVTHRVMIRYRPDIDYFYEMLWDGWCFEIKRSGLLNSQKTFLVLEIKQKQKIINNE